MRTYTITKLIPLNKAENLLRYNSYEEYKCKFTLHASIFNTLCFEHFTHISWGLYLGLVIIFKLIVLIWWILSTKMMQHVCLKSVSTFRLKLILLVYTIVKTLANKPYSYHIKTYFEKLSNKITYYTYCSNQLNSLFQWREPKLGLQKHTMINALNHKNTLIKTFGLEVVIAI